MIRVSHRARAKSWTLSTSMDDLVDEGVQDAETIWVWQRKMVFQQGHFRLGEGLYIYICIYVNIYIYI